jgi:hypothetical protein
VRTLLLLRASAELTILQQSIMGGGGYLLGCWECFTLQWGWTTTISGIKAYVKKPRSVPNGRSTVL